RPCSWSRGTPPQAAAPAATRAAVLPCDKVSLGRLFGRARTVHAPLRGAARLGAGREPREDLERRLADGQLVKLRVDTPTLDAAMLVTRIDFGRAHRQR